VTGVCCWFIANCIPDTNILWVLLKAVATFVISNIAVFMCYFKSKEFKYLFGIAKNFRGIMKNNEANK